MSLNVENCPRCGKIFRRFKYSICPDCMKKVDEEYDKCYKFLRKKENRACTLNELSEATGVSMRQITSFITEGRLLIENNPNIDYPCRICATPIRQGMYCKTCLEKVNKMIESLDERRKDELRQEQLKKAQSFYQIKRDEK